MRLSFFLIFTLVTFCACRQPNAIVDESLESKTIYDSSRFPTSLAQGLTAHGGLGTWNKINTMEFTVNGMLGGKDFEEPERQVTNLKNRKERISTNLYTIGFDGNDVWVTPRLEAFTRTPPRFYHGLYLYFFSLPFIITDPGVEYEDLGRQEANGKVYNVVRCSFSKGIGDSPHDEYFLHFDVTTNLMEVILYSATYFTNKKAERYGFGHYKEWQRVNGLLVPSKIDWYQYENGRTKGEPFATAVFTNVLLNEQAPPDSLFARPANAVIDTLRVE